MASKKFPLLAALLLSACSGSLIDHLGVDLGTGQFPDGGDAGCTGSSCQASCDCAPANATAQCDGNACSFTCNATFFRSGTACISPSRIAAGGDSTCAILQDATVSCWGQPLGAATTPSEVPAAVPGLTQVAHLAVGSGHACAVMLDNATINCWGNNDSGQLGTPAATAASAEAPGITTTLTSVSDIVVGDHHTCALTSAGAVCWGANDVGQLGDGSTSPNAGRNTVVNTAGATGISGGKRHTCVSINGGVSCWGSDDSGQIGDGPNTTAPATRATAAAFKGGGVSISGIASGASHTCGIDGTDFWCWGLGTSGQLGNGAAGNQSSPQKADIGSVRVMAGGAAHTCAVGSAASGDDDSGGTVTPTPGLFCWGANDSSQLGIGGGTLLAPAVLSPTPLDFANVSQLVAGSNHTCALLTAGDLLCWGANANGQAGVSPRGSPVATPKQVRSQ